MPKRKKQEHDFSLIAHRVVQQATGQDESDEDEPTLEEAPKADYAALAARKVGLLGLRSDP